MVYSLGEAAFATVTMLVVYFAASQGFVSLLGRAVPFTVVDQAVILPHLRGGVPRIVNLVWTLFVAVATQLTIILVLTRASDTTARLVLLLELVIAIAWTLVLVATGRRQRSEM